MLSVDKTIAVDPVATVDPVALEKSISSATEALLGYRQSDGHFVFELEADSTIPSEYILLRHYLAEPVDSVLEAKIANYLRRTQGDHGGWPLVHDGPFDMSASVKSYFALKMIGDSVDAPHMVRAREAIRSRGGAARVNVFTRFLLRFLRRAELARGAGAADRDHAAADVVAVPHQQDFLLGAHHDRAADGDGGVEAAGEESQGRRHRRVVPAGSQVGRHDAEGAASELGLVHAVQHARQDPAGDRAAVSEEAAPARDRRRARFHRGAAERRRRHGRDLSADGQHRHDV